jgi:PAS domain S-box-containing protein
MSEQLQEPEKPAVTPTPVRLNSPLGAILVVDDEPELKKTLVESLIRQGFGVTGCRLAQQALTELRAKNFDVLLTDLMMPEMDGISLLQSALEIDPHLVVIIMTGQGTIQTAIEAMKLGAFDYVLKPFRMATLMPVLTRAINTRHLRLENLQLRETLAIYSLSQTIAFTLDPQTVLSKLADAALQQSEADEVSILLPTNDGSELYVAAVRGEKRERLLGERIPFDQSIASWVARERTPVILNGAVHDERFVSLWPRADIRSSISVPMQVANKLVGVINLNVTSRLRPFTLGQLKALTILAGTAAAALESASLYSQVRRAEENYRSIFENAIEGIFQSTSDGRFITVNPAMARILRYDSPEDLIASITDVTRQLYVHPESRAEAARLEEQSGIVQGFEFEAYRKDGEKIWLSVNRRSVRNESGVEVYREGSIEEITERKRAEEALRESEERYRELVENAHDIIYEHDLQGNYTSTNKAGEQITGYSREETCQLNLTQTVAPGYIEKAREMLRRKLDGETITAYEVETIAKDGSRISLEVNSSLVFHNGVPVGVQGIARDVTERKRLEEQLRQSQKLEAIGQLAGGVAHDFNNLLTVISGYSDLLLRRLPADDPLKAHVTEIKKAGDRAAGLTRQLLAFSRKQILQPKVLDLNTVVSDLDKMLRPLIGEDVDLLTKTEPGLGQVKADPGQIEQVVVNLVVNARDAMEHGGKVTIETSNVKLTEAYAHQHEQCPPGAYVMLAVSDTGSGIDPAIRDRIFEPFFSTKGAGKGTGLGLSTVYGIVKQSGGNIYVYSEVGIGTVFKIYLPRVDANAADEVTRAGVGVAPGGDETVLLVEDEAQVRQIAQQILESLGYHVLAAENGEQALTIAADYPEDIQLMITDVVMPQMGGLELVERLTPLRKNLRVIYMSGYTDDAIVRHGLIDDRLEFIQKPFTPDALARKVRTALESAPGESVRVGK